MKRLVTIFILTFIAAHTAKAENYEVIHQNGERHLEWFGAPDGYIFWRVYANNEGNYELTFYIYPVPASTYYKIDVYAGDDSMDSSFAEHFDVDTSDGRPKFIQFQTTVIQEHRNLVINIWSESADLAGGAESVSIAFPALKPVAEHTTGGTWAASLTGILFAWLIFSPLARK